MSVVNNILFFFRDSLGKMKIYATGTTDILHSPILLHEVIAIEFCSNIFLVFCVVLNLVTRHIRV